MMELIEKIYLTPPDNEAIPVTECFFVVKVFMLAMNFTS